VGLVHPAITVRCCTGTGIGTNVEQSAGRSALRAATRPGSVGSAACASAAELAAPPVGSHPAATPERPAVHLAPLSWQ
jgi:hypothetical protein